MKQRIQITSSDKDTWKRNEKNDLEWNHQTLSEQNLIIVVNILREVSNWSPNLYTRSYKANKAIKPRVNALLPY